MGDAEPVGDSLGVVDVLPSAATAGAADRLAVVIELQGDADDLRPGLCSKGGGDRAVDAAGQGNDDSRLLGGAPKIKADGH